MASFLRGLVRSSGPIQLALRRNCSSWVAPVRNDAFLKRKYGALFKAYDMNKDGYFSKEDIEAQQAAFVKLGKLDGEAKEQFIKYSNEYYEGWIDGWSTKLNQEAFVSRLLWFRTQAADDMKKMLKLKADELHHALDHNDDGAVDQAGFSEWAKLTLIDDHELALQLFNLIDHDSSGKVDVSEMTDFFVGFMMHENMDPPTQLFFDIAGPTHGV